MAHISVTIDDAHQRRLAELAAQQRVGEDVLAAAMLSEALDDSAHDGARMTALLDSIPGAWERTQEGIEQAERGEGVPLEDLLA